MADRHSEVLIDALNQLLQAVHLGWCVELKDVQDLKKLARLTFGRRRKFEFNRLYEDQQFAIVCNDGSKYEVDKVIGIILWEGAGPRPALQTAYDLSVEPIGELKAAKHHGIEYSELFLPWPILVISEQARKLSRGESDGIPSATKVAYKGMTKQCPWVRLLGSWAGILEGIAHLYAWSKEKRRFSAILVEDKVKLKDLKGDLLNHLRVGTEESRLELVSPRIDGEHPLKITKVIEQIEKKCADKATQGILMDFDLEEFWEKGTDEASQFTGLDVMTALRPTRRQAENHTYRRMGSPPIVLLTGYADKQHILQAMRSGADEYVTKTYSGSDEIYWPESLTRAFHVLFVLHAKRLRLQHSLCTIASILCGSAEDERKAAEYLLGRLFRGHGDMADIADRKRLSGNLRLIHAKLNEGFPPGGVPTFLHESYSAVRMILREFERLIKDHQELSGSTRALMHSFVMTRNTITRVIEALEAIPDEQRLCCHTCDCQGLFGCKPNFLGERKEHDDVVKALIAVFKDVHRYLSERVERQVIHVAREL